VVICLEQGADLHVAQLMPLTLTVSCFSKIQIGFAFLVPAHPGSPGQRAVKRVCVCVCVCHLPVSHACLHCAICTTCKDIFSGIFCIHKQIIRADARVVYTVKTESVQYVLFYNNVYMTAVWSNWACVSRFK